MFSSYSGWQLDNSSGTNFRTFFACSRNVSVSIKYFSTGAKRALRILLNAFWSGYEVLAMVFGLGGLAVICLLGLPFAFLFLILTERRRVLLGRRAIAHSFSIYLWYLRLFFFVRIDCSELRAIQNTRPLIVVANHPSLLDAVILLSRLPYALCVMKAKLKNNILFGIAARVSGYISNESPKDLVQQACNDLAKGAHLLIFPEGTRTTQQPVNPFGKTTALIALRSGVAIQTVFIDFGSPYLGKSWPLFRKPILPLRISVKLGEKFDPSSDIAGLTEKMESYYRQQLVSK